MSGPTTRLDRRSTSDAKVPTDRQCHRHQGDTCPVRQACLLIFPVLVLLSGCGSGSAADDSAQPSTTAQTTDSEPNGSEQTAEAPTSSTASSSSTPATTSSTAPSNEVDPGCRLVADLEDDDEVLRWSIVNDGVMGGRSRAEAEITDSVLSANGEIVTDGGGFSSIRLALDEPFGDAGTLVMRVRTDGRAYEVTVADTAPGRDRRTAHQAPIPAAGGDRWEEVTIDLASLQASIFGQPIDDEPFKPELAVEVGVILADGIDGPFRFELDWIRACP